MLQKIAYYLDKTVEIIYLFILDEIIYKQKDQTDDFIFLIGHLTEESYKDCSVWDEIIASPQRDSPLASG